MAKTNFIKDLKYMWKGKLILTTIITFMISLPFIINGMADIKTWFMLLIVFPIIIWLSVTYNLEVYGEDLKEKNESNSSSK